MKPYLLSTPRGVLSTAFLVASLSSAAGLLNAAPPPWHYAARIGLFDARHTGADGVQVSDIVQLGGSCVVLGTSDLFVGSDDVASAPARQAQTAWVAGPDGPALPVGLYDADHTRDDGRQEADPLEINLNGVSIGSSTRFAGHRYAGSSAWVATPEGTTRQMGFYDGAHRAPDGSTLSAMIDLNNADKFVGFSENPETGHRTGWIANTAGQINPIGLFDAAHTAADGHRASFPVALNDAGYAIGNSDYFAAGETFPGATSWVRRPDKSVRVIGFQSGMHVAADGQHLGRVGLLTESGYMAGWSIRYLPGSSEGIGQTAWVTHIDGPNRAVGFYADEHLGPRGSVHSQVRDVNERGYASGISFQYDDAGVSEFDQAGSTAWIATPSGATVRVGLYDAEHSVNDRQFNELVALNDHDAVVGTAARYRSDGDYFGLDAFVANAAGYTTTIALTDPMHTRSDGYRASQPTALTGASGCVAGYSERFNGGAVQLGRTAWIYRRSTRTFVRIEPSVRPSDGYADATITRLLEDGSAVGRFRLFASDGRDLGDRAFAYLPESGVHVLERAIDEDVSNAGWQAMADAEATLDLDCIAGTGPWRSDTAYGYGVFMLVAPLPGAP